jgi:hypothetical protein
MFIERAVVDGLSLVEGGLAYTDAPGDLPEHLLPPRRRPLFHMPGCDQPPSPTPASSHVPDSTPVYKLLISLLKYGSPMSGPLINGGSFKCHPWSATACRYCKRILCPVSDMSAPRPTLTASKGIHYLHLNLSLPHCGYYPDQMRRLWGGEWMQQWQVQTR